MRRFCLAILLTLLTALPVRAEERAEAIIASQIEAFRADDFETAFGFASPGIQTLFGSPDRFAEMVRQGYPMVHRPAELRFLGAVDQPGGLRQRVMVEDASGQVHILAYDMVEIDGAWRIDGVTLLDADVGA